MGYAVELDDAWATRAVRVESRTAKGAQDLELRRARDDTWTVGGRRRPDLDGCVDVDFESSAVTNTLPIHRLDLGLGDWVDVPAAFVRADDLHVQRLDQRYTLTARDAEGLRFDYESSTFGFACELRYDAAGLVVEYPGIASRES